MSMSQVNHVVLMQIKAEVGQGQIDALYKELAGLVPLIPGLLSFSGGPYSSPEGFNKQWGHGFSMVFADEASRDGYLPHPEHERVRDLLLPLVDDVIAFDYLLPEQESVKSAADVLTFWYGLEYFADKSQLSLDAYLSGRSQSLWYAGSSVDAACRAFVPTIEAAAATGLLAGQDLDEQMARIILFDQLARNAHRGTAKAFAYDDLAVRQARETAEKEAEFTPAHVCFVVSPLLHSEQLEDHDLGLALSSRSIERWPDNGQLKFVQKFCREHRDVIERFGRYPHRNKAKGRESSADEEAWLASEGCPGWAKSQESRHQANHVVLMQIKAEVGQGQIDALYKELAGLVPLVPGLLSFSGGPYSSPEGFNKQWGHGFSMVFADEASRDGYLPHPEHERVRDLLLPLVDDVIAFDYLL